MENFQQSDGLPNKETQVKIWKKLSGKWKDKRKTSEIIEDIYSNRSKGLDFPQIVERALSGEELIIVKNGKPLLLLQPIESGRKRIPGLSLGKGKMSDDFDAPLTEEILSDLAL